MDIVSRLLVRAKLEKNFTIPGEWQAAPRARERSFRPHTNAWVKRYE